MIEKHLKGPPPGKDAAPLDLIKSELNNLSGDYRKQIKNNHIILLPFGDKNIPVLYTVKK